MSKKPIVAKVENYLQKNRIETGKSPLQNYGTLKKFGELGRYDLSANEELDSPHAPKAEIRAAEKLMAQLYYTRDAHYLLNGTSVGLQAAVMASCKPGDKILIPRNAGRKLWDAVALSGATPVWLPVFIHPRFGIALGVATETVEQAVTEYDGARAMVFVYPSEHGFCGDLRTTARLAGHKGMLTIVDETHGAHFKFTGWPDPAIDSGAAVVVNGWNETMGSLNQTAVMLQNDHNYPIEKYLDMLTSDAVSYPLLLALDEARANWQANDDRLAAKMLKNAAILREGLAGNTVLDCLDSRNIPWPVRDYDSCRLVLFSELNHSGWQIAEALKKAGVAVAHADNGTVTVVASAFNTAAETREISRRIKEAGRALEKIKGKILPVVDFGELPKQIITPGEVLARDTEWAELAAAEGRIAADLIVPFPCGVPAVGPGEEISGAVAAGVEYILEEGGRVQGVENGKVLVIK
ncbi:MAG: hypothetical protein ACOX7J_06315 [Bacillota bacterium]